MKKQIFGVSIIGITFFAALTTGCQNTATNTSDTNQVSMNTANGANAVSSPVVSPTAVAVSSVIETGEPNQYSATMQLSARTTGRNMSLPTITANVAREGENGAWRLICRITNKSFI